MAAWRSRGVLRLLGSVSLLPSFTYFVERNDGIPQPSVARIFLPANMMRSGKTIVYLGIDVGTSAVKAIIINENGDVIRQATAPLNIQSPQALWTEQDPEDWWDAVCACCSQMSTDPRYRNVRAVGLSGQMHGAVCLDDALRPIRPAILWNDGRSDAECEEMRVRLPEIGAVSGVLPMPGFTAPKILWLAKVEPDSHARIRHVLLPKDYVRLKLTGKIATDISDAAGTMWLDQQTRQWSRRVCDISATEDSWLPELFEGTDVTGALTAKAARTLGLREGTPVAGGGGDAAAGAVGIGAINEGDAFISLGTSGQLFVATEKYRPEPESLIHAYAHCVPERWFQMAAMLNGASALGWWATACDAPIETLLAELEAGEPDRVPLFLPYLSGERTPHNDSNIRGAFYGLSGDTSRAAMTLAVIDAIAYTLCDARDALAAANTVIDSVAVIGGGAKSHRLLQTISDALGIELRRYQGAEHGPALGAARLGMIAVGGGKIQSVSVLPPTDRFFHPNTDATHNHEARLGNFRRLYRALSPLAADETFR